MSMAAKLEYALLTPDEIAIVRSTHHPEIYSLSRKELSDLRVRLRELRSKAKTLTRHKQREARGKAEPRGRSFPGNTDQPLLRKQVFAAATKRVNREIARLEQLDAKASHVEAAQRALVAFRTSGFASGAPASRKPDTGMTPKDAVKRRRIVRPGTIGSVLKQNATAQAIRDAR